MLIDTNDLSTTGYAPSWYHYTWHHHFITIVHDMLGLHAPWKILAAWRHNRTLFKDYKLFIIVWQTPIQLSTYLVSCFQNLDSAEDMSAFLNMMQTSLAQKTGAKRKRSEQFLNASVKVSAKRMEDIVQRQGSSIVMKLRFRDWSLYKLKF